MTDNITLYWILSGLVALELFIILFRHRGEKLDIVFALYMCLLAGPLTLVLLAIFFIASFADYLEGPIGNLIESINNFLYTEIK